MRSIATISLSLFALLFVSSCDSEFSPKAEFTPQLAVWCVLNTSDSVQVVRLARSYDGVIGQPPLPLTSTEVAGAVVTLSDTKKTVTLADTLLRFADGSQERVWLTRAISALPDGNYTLKVRVDGLDTLTLPLQAPGRLYPTIKFTLSDTNKSLVTLVPGVRTMDHPPHGYYFRLWVELRPAAGGTAIRGEVPQMILPGSNEWIYSQPGRSAELSYPIANIKLLHDRLKGADTTLFNKTLLVQAWSLDEHIYNYLKAAQGFDDPRSLRVDRPNVTYVPGGLGLFGAVVADSSRLNYHFYVK